MALAENHTVETPPPAETGAPPFLAFMAWFELAAAVVLILILLRIAFIIASNPIGEFAVEMFYLRLQRLQLAGLLLLGILLLEIVELVLPILELRGVLASSGDVVLYLNVAQASLLVVAAVSALVLLQNYTTRGLERHIEVSMGQLAAAQGQRRRGRRRE